MIQADIKEHQPPTTAVSRNQIDQHYSYKENNEFSNPFIMDIKLWQNYSTMWMSFYNDILKYYSKLNKDYRNIN